MERATIKVIANKLGVSAKTVSKALNDRTGVSEELRLKIKKLAEELNYVPNLFGRGLQGRSTKTVGVIISDNANPNNSNIVKGIEEIAAKYDYNIILCNSNENIDIENKHIQVLIEKHIDGIILHPSPVASGKERLGIEKLKQMGIPYMLTNRSIAGEKHDCVKTDNILGARLATNYLINKGHRNIIHLTTKNMVSSNLERIEGYKNTLIENGINVDENNIYTCDSLTIESSRSAMLNILRERKDFTAVFAFNDIVAYGVIKAIHECRLRIPADIAVMGYDDIPYSELCLVPLTTIHQENNFIGATAMEILLNKINGESNEVEELLIKPYLVERMSV